MNETNCLFCKILTRKIPSSIVYESDVILGFKDANPKAPVHVLFVPKKHLNSVQEISPAESGMIDGLVLAANQVAKESNIHQSGYRLVINCKSEGGQTVDHLHLHLLGGRAMTWPPG